MFNIKVTYDKSCDMGYIYFNEPSKYQVSYTEELEENDEIMLDFGKEVPVVGIELEGTTAKMISTLVNKENILEKKINDEGTEYYSLKITNQLIKRSVSHPEAKSLVFHFSDEKYENLTRIDILDSHLFSN